MMGRARLGLEPILHEAQRPPLALERALDDQAGDPLLVALCHHALQDGRAVERARPLAGRIARGARLKPPTRVARGGRVGDVFGCSFGHGGAPVG
jgi:hypothetical protein